MNESYLITGTPSPVLLGLVARLIRDGNQVTVLAEEGSELDLPDNESVTLVRSNPRSPLAIRSFLLGLKVQEKQIDHVVYVFHPQTQGKTLAELETAALDRAVDRDIKGLLFPIREVLSTLQRQGRGSLDFVCVGGLNTLLPPLAAAAYGALQEMAKSLFILYQNEPVVLRGQHFDTDISESQAVETVLTAIQENSPKSRGKWNKVGSKSSFFGLRRNAL